MKTKSRLLFVGVILIIVLILTVSMVNAADIASGTTGTCSWKITSSGQFTIYPTSGSSCQPQSITFMTSDSYTPWSSYASQVKSFYISPSHTINAPQIMSNYFAGMSNCKTWTGLDRFNMLTTTRLYGLFRNCSGASSFSGIEKWNTSNVQSMTEMFYGCSSCKFFDISAWNMSALKNGANFKSGTGCDNMFYGCTAVINTLFYKSDMNPTKLYILSKSSYKNFTTTDLTSNPSNLVFLPYTVTVSVSNGSYSIANATNLASITSTNVTASIYDSSSKKLYVIAGKSPVITITPITNYQISTVTDNSKSVTVSSGKYTISAISANHAIVAKCTGIVVYSTIKTKVTWDDANNRDGYRPESICLILTGSDKSTIKKLVSGTGNDWSYTFTSVPTKNTGVAITYTLSATASCE